MTHGIGPVRTMNVTTLNELADLILRYGNERYDAGNAGVGTKKTADEHSALLDAAYRTYCDITALLYGVEE